MTFPGEQPARRAGQLPLADSGAVEKIICVHRDKDSNWSLWEKLVGASGLADDGAGQRFSYTLCEIGLACRIDLDTGAVVVYGVEDGDEIVPLAREIKEN